MKERLSSTGVKRQGEATQVLSTPAASATSDMNQDVGEGDAGEFDVSANLSASAAKRARDIDQERRRDDAQR